MFYIFSLAVVEMKNVEAKLKIWSKKKIFKCLQENVKHDKYPNSYLEIVK